MGSVPRMIAGRLKAAETKHMEILKHRNRVLDTKRYQRLLSRALPTVIETEEQNEKTLAFIETLMQKGEQLNAEEEALLRLLARLVEDFEERYYAPPDAESRQMLLHLMEARGVGQSEIAKLFGSKGVASEVVNGKRGISKANARALSGFFHVPAGLFI
jgi:HTH-type transcriptional regulator/antitoxin HigA